MTTESRKLGTVAFVGLVTALALWLLTRAGWPEQGLPRLTAWFAACLVGEVFWLRTAPRQGIISIALALNLAAIFALGSGSGLSVIALSTLVASVYPHHRQWYKALFNTAQSVVAAAAALLIWKLVSPTSAGQGPLREIWLPLLPAGAVFCLANSGLVAVVVALHIGQSPWRAWRENFGYRYELLSCAAEISLAGFLLTAYQLTGIVALAAILPLLAVLWLASAREVKARVQEAAAEPEETRLPLRIAI